MIAVTWCPTEHDGGKVVPLQILAIHIENHPDDGLGMIGQIQQRVRTEKYLRVINYTKHLTHPHVNMLELWVCLEQGDPCTSKTSCVDQHSCARYGGKVVQNDCGPFGLLSAYTIARCLRHMCTSRPSAKAGPVGCGCQECVVSFLS